MDQYPILLGMEKVTIITIITKMETTMSIAILVILVGVGVASLISLIQTRPARVAERKKDQEQAVAKLVETLKEAGVPVLPHPLKGVPVEEVPVVEVKVEEPVVIPVVEAVVEPVVVVEVPVVLQETVVVDKPVRTKKARKPRQKRQKAKQI